MTSTLCQIVPHGEGYAVRVVDSPNETLVLDPEGEPMTLMEAELVAALVETYAQRTLAT